MSLPAGRASVSARTLGTLYQVARLSALVAQADLDTSDGAAILRALERSLSELDRLEPGWLRRADARSSDRSRKGRGR